VSRKRILHIGIAPREYIHRRMLDIAEGAGRRQPDEPRVWFTSAEALARVLSKKNMILIETIRHSGPASVTELAERVGRNKTNVLRSLKTLKQFEIVDFDEGEGGRKAPRLNYDDFRVDGRLGHSLDGKAA
jgi:predicted transcriptional regulator